MPLMEFQVHQCCWAAGRGTSLPSPGIKPTSLVSPALADAPWVAFIYGHLHLYLGASSITKPITHQPSLSTVLWRTDRHKRMERPAQDNEPIAWGLPDTPRHGGRAGVPVRIHVYTGMYMRARVLGGVCVCVCECISEPVAHVECVCMYTCRVCFCAHTYVHPHMCGCVFSCAHPAGKSNLGRRRNRDCRGRDKCFPRSSECPQCFLC